MPGWKGQGTRDRIRPLEDPRFGGGLVPSEEGLGMVKIGRTLGVGTSVVQRVVAL